MNNEIKQGDKVMVDKAIPNMYLVGFGYTVLGDECKVREIDEGNALIRWKDNYITIPTKYLIKVNTEAKAAKFKVGDMVIVKQDVEMSKTFSIFKRKFSIVKRIDNDKATLEINRMKHGDLELTDVPLECIEKVDAIEYLHGNGLASKEQKEAEKKTNVGSIKIPVEVDITDSYWDAYTADLAKEVAVMLVRTHRNDLNKVAKISVDIAKAVVEGLKRK